MNYERNLVTIEEIGNLSPIEGADFLECASILGWECVVKKGEYKIGEKVVYFSVDSFLPIREEFEFLRKNCYKQIPGVSEGFRIKTIKLKRQISQGLVMPLSILPEGSYEIGDNVTEILGVTKYEPPLSGKMIGANAVGNFPSFIPKTDQPRFQGLREKEKDLTQLYEVSLKLDGSSGTFFVNGDEFGVCSRNLQLKLDQDSTWKNIANIYDIEKKIRSLGRNIAIQGEVMGPGIQKNREGFNTHRLFVFDVYDIDAQRYLTSSERLDMINWIGLEHVPIIATNFNVSRETVQSLIQLVESIPSINHKICEGLVFKGIERPYNSFKVINPQFLLKEE